MILCKDCKNHHYQKSAIYNDCKIHFFADANRNGDCVDFELKEENVNYNYDECRTMIDLITSNEYTPKGYGYIRQTKESTHWITLFDDSLQMYAYYTGDEECEKIYDTGVVKLSSSELQTLIDIFIHNHD